MVSFQFGNHAYMLYGFLYDNFCVCKEGVKCTILTRLFLLPLALVANGCTGCKPMENTFHIMLIKCCDEQ